MNRLTLAFSIAALMTLQGNGLAQQRERGQKRDSGQASKTEASQGLAPQATDKPASPNMDRRARRPAGQFDPTILIARMMKEFDADGDEKLDLKELTKLMTSMRDRRQAGGTAEGPGGLRNRDANSGRREANLRQGRRGIEPGAGKSGGDKPIRPTDK